MLVRGAFNHILRPGLRKDFRDAYKSHVEEYSKLLRVGNQDRAEVEATNIAGLPRMPIRGEAENIVYMDPVMGDKITFLDDEYALGFAVSKKLMEDDLYHKATQNAKWLGRSARLAQEYKAAALLDDAFSGSVFTGVQSEALITTSHTLLNSDSSGTNRLATDVQLSVTGMQVGLELAENTVDETNDPIPVMPDTLIINVADIWMAIQLTQNQDEAFTNDRNVNSIMRHAGAMKFVVSHYKTQGNDWFLRDSQMSDAWFLFRVKPEFEDTFDFDTKAAKFTGRQRINVYFFDWRGWIGSSP